MSGQSEEYERLSSAVVAGKWNLAIELVRAGADIYKKPSAFIQKDDWLLEVAFTDVKSSDDDCANFIRACAEHCLRHDERITQTGKLPWQQAIEYGHVGLCEDLLYAYERALKKKADIDLSAGGPPILFQVLDKAPERRDIISFLLSKGANPEITGNIFHDGWRVMDCFELAAIRDEKSPGLSAFFRAEASDSLVKKINQAVIVSKPKFKPKP